MLKGAGFCLNSNCIHFGKPAFYMGMEDVFLCSTCEKLGFLEKNRDSYEGAGLIQTVAVHFRYDVTSRSYKSTALVTDEALQGKRVLNMYRPFIHFDKSALALAEKALADVATGHSGLIFDASMDKENFNRAINKLSKSLQSEYLRADLGPMFHSLGDLT